MRNIVRGTLGSDILSATETIRESLYGRKGDDVFVFFRDDFRGDPSQGDPDFSDRFFGGKGNDSLTGLSFFFQNDDSYDYYAQTSFDGGAGIDSIVFDMSISTRALNSIELNRFTALTRSVEIREFDMLAAASEDFFSVIDIYGSSDRETVRMNLIDSGEMAINVRMGGGADRFEIFGDQHVGIDLNVSMGNGNDTVIVNATTVHNSDVAGALIKTGRGADTVVLEGMHSETVRTNQGNDKIYLLTGSFANQPDTVYTGGGKDKVFVELDAYSKIAILPDFSARKDVIVFDSLDVSKAEVVFDADDWKTGEDANLFMNNDTGKLFYGKNLMIDFDGPTSLTAANFIEEDWEFSLI